MNNSILIYVPQEHERIFKQAAADNGVYVTVNEIRPDINCVQYKIEFHSDPRAAYFFGLAYGKDMIRLEQQLKK